MLEPSSNFTAKEVQFLQNEASDWIEYVNKQIIAAASSGKSEVYIDISERDPIGKKYWKSPGPLIEHFKSRGFTHEFNGQCTTIFKWEERKVEFQREFANIQSLPDEFEVNVEIVNGRGLKEKIIHYLFGVKKGDANV